MSELPTGLAPGGRPLRHTPGTWRRWIWALSLTLPGLLHAHTLSPSAAPRVTRPLWEWGVGVAALQWPDYRGADHSQTYVLPLPYVVYRGHFLRADKQGARAVLLEQDRVEIDVSLNGSAPVRSDPDGARAGMANLPPTFEIGPNLNLRLWRSEDAKARLDFRLPLRVALTAQLPMRSIGTVLSPKLNLDLNLNSGWNVGLLAGPLYGSRRYHEHYYGVSETDARPDRPAYTAKGGHAGWHALASTSRRFDRTWVAAYVRHDRMGGAVFADSPLVKRTHAWSFGIGLAWVLGTSTQTVEVAP